MAIPQYKLRQTDIIVARRAGDFAASKPWRNIVMSRRSIVSLAATVMIGGAGLVTISNDASA
jgi:hypothetical protein